LLIENLCPIGFSIINQQSSINNQQPTIKNQKSRIAATQA